MPNHFCNQIMVVGAEYDENEEIVPWVEKLRRFWEGEKPDQILDEVMPRPEGLYERGGGFGLMPYWFEWCASDENWGTKWGLYSVEKPVPLPGDVFGSVCWQMQSASSAPSPKARKLVCLMLLTMGASEVMWIGADPFDDSIAMLGHYKRSDIKGLNDE